MQKRKHKGFLDISPYNRKNRSFIVPMNEHGSSSITGYIKRIYDMRTQINIMRKKFDKLADTGKEIQTGQITDYESERYNVPNKTMRAFTQERKARTISSVRQSVIRPNIKLRIASKRKSTAGAH